MRFWRRPVQISEQFKDDPAWPFGQMRKPVKTPRPTQPADVPPAPF
jgi:hypothetical protein